MISGGFAGGGESSSARKAHLRSIRSGEVMEVQAVSKLPRLDTTITFMEVYIDDMLVKSTTTELHIAHLSEAFQILREYNMKLNPSKCAFRVSARKFLGFIVNNRGIEANPDKIKAVLDMPPPSNIKEV